MRSVILSLLAAVFLISACNNNKPKNTATFTSEDGKEKVSIDATQVAGATDEMTKRMEELKKLPPMTTDQLKALFPDMLAGVKRTSFSVNSMLGFAVGDAEYKINDTANLKLVAYDCAGEAGSSFYSLNFFMKMNAESQSDDRYSKTIDYLGGKAIESYEKSNSSYTLMFTANDRLLVSLQGQNTTLDMVKEAGQQLHLKVN